ncbi:CHAT domain-containing protein [Suillus americanus]|nr:CHAT domain-containing protein [Suillus americanus]
MPGNLEERYIRLEVIIGKNLRVPSWRFPAGIYVSINVDSQKRWKSAISVLSSDESVAWGNTVTLSSHASPALSVEIRASYEAGRMLGSGEVIGKLQMSWDELLDHGDEPFNLSFPPVRDVHPSLTLKAAVVHACDDEDSALSDSLVVDSDIIRVTDAGHARLAKYMTSRTVSHLNDAVQHFQLVLDQCPVSHPDHAAVLTNLAYSCLEGYIQNHLQDIDTTTSLFREALALRPQGHPDHASSLYNLIKALIWRYSKESTTVYIHESAQLCCKLLPLCPEGTYPRSIGVNNAVSYVISACNNLPIDASDEGIHLRRNILELCPMGHQHRLNALDKLAWALFTRFTERGNIDDIDESVHLRREAVYLCPEGHSDRAGHLRHLALSLMNRFNHEGKPNDLDEAITLYEEALHFRPVEHEFCGSLLDNIGAAFFARFNKRGDIDDITRAISLFREALMLELHQEILKLYFCNLANVDLLVQKFNFNMTALKKYKIYQYSTTLSNLAVALKSRYDKLNVSEDRNESIDRYRESLRLRRLDHPERHRTLCSLSSVLCSRFKHTRKNEDAEEAIQLCREALADLSSAMEHFRQSSIHPTEGFPRRIRVAIDWARQADIYQHESALEAYQMCFELFDSHVMTRSSIISRREAATAFHGAQSLPVDAASCAIRRGNLRPAVELVEQARGQQWSLASRLRTPLEDLESASPQLAQQLSELSKRLSHAQGSAGTTDPAAADRAATEYRRLARQWEAAVAEIRGLQGFSRFLLPPSYEDLQAAARQGPVIIFIASQYSCSAIIVPTSGDPHHVSLPSVSLTELNNLKGRFARAIRHASIIGPKVPRNDLIVLLRTVWDAIMLPIVNVLENVLELKHRSRIWLCPTAAFTSIPLHAAHPFQTKSDGSKEPCLEDLYICSYTPTLSALVRSRQMMKRRVAPSFATIGQGQPGAGKGKVLLAVDSEIKLVQKFVPATATRINVSGGEATRAGALQALEENTWVHLACHGKQDPTQPYNSHFVMRDEHLTLLDIMDKDIPHAEFAFLSACHTAVGDEETPDEVIHLAAGLQFSGFKSVIGTLWEVNDAVAKHVVEAFYKYMFMDLKDGTGVVMDCTRAAWALNRATHAVKTKVPLEQRMVFIHIDWNKVASAVDELPTTMTMCSIVFLSSRVKMAPSCSPRSDSNCRAEALTTGLEIFIR